ncbi:MAG: haloacid dehalogenase type II [Telluria sp.]
MACRLQQLGFLGFDVFGTVVDWRSGVARAAAPFLERYDIALDPYAFANAWRALYQPSLERVRSGARPWTRLAVLQRENLEQLLAGHGVVVDDIPEPDLAGLTRAWDELDPWPDAVAGLARLKRRFAIAPISNGHIAGMLQLARFGGLPWDAILGAEISHTYKPQPETYLKSLEAAGYAPAESAMVAAHNGDLRAAREVGMRTIFVHRPHEYGPDQHTDLRAEEEWDVVAASLAEVADALGCA